MQQPWKVIFAFVAVFIAGAVFGGVFSLRASGKRWRQGAAATPSAPAVVVKEKEKELRPAGLGINGAQMRQWTQRLNLTSEQRKQIGPIITQANREFARLRQDTTQVQQKLYADVAAVLTPEQRAQLEEEKRKIELRIAEEKKKRQDAMGKKPQS